MRPRTEKPLPSNTLFISDLHLCAERPAVTELFLQFLQYQATQSKALYILGDLFEAWIGDDDTDAEHARIIAGLRQLTGQGVELFLMHGNRDFLIGSNFAQTTACRLLPDECVIDLYGEPTLLMHGDTLCTQDTEYQALRTQIRNTDWQQAFLAKPLSQRAALARQYRAESQEKTRQKADYIMDVDQHAVEATMRRHQVTRLIHGHTHRPAVHEFSMNGRPAQRIVLGDWYEQGSSLQCSTHGCYLTELPL